MLAEFFCRLKAVLFVFSHGTHHDGVEFWRNRWVVCRWGCHGFAHVLIGNRDSGVTFEWRATCEQLVEQNTGGVEVGAGVDTLAAGLLGREVLGGADDAGGGCLRGRVVADGAGDTEVHHLHAVTLHDHDVGGLDVTVHDTRAV